MKLIDKYILTRSIWPFVYCLSAFLILIVLVDLFEHLDSIIKNKVNFFIIVKYYLYLIPVFAVQISPIAVLLASMYIIGGLSKHNEITAMKASGINLFRIVSPFFLFGIIVSLVIIILNETFIPKTIYQHTFIKEKYISDSSSKSVFFRNNIAFVSKKYSYFIKQYNVEQKEIHGITILKYSKTGDLKARIDAEKGRWTGTGWRFYKGILREFEDKIETTTKSFNEKFILIPEKPESFAKSHSMELMTYKELRNHIQNIKNNGGNPIKEKVFLNSKISMPFANFIVLLIGIPLILKIANAGIITGIVLSLVISFVYRVIIVIGISLGNSGIFHPFLAAWFGNLIFLSIGLFLVWKIDT